MGFGEMEFIILWNSKHFKSPRVHELMRYKKINSELTDAVKLNFVKSMRVPKT